MSETAAIAGAYNVSAEAVEAALNGGVPAEAIEDAARASLEGVDFLVALPVAAAIHRQRLTERGA